MTKPANADQTDIIAANESLTAQLAAAVAERDSFKTKLEASDAKVTSLTADLAARTTERDTLKAENATLKTQVADFNKSVAGQVAKLGIADGNSAGKETKTEKQLTVTEKCLAAKGKK